MKKLLYHLVLLLADRITIGSETWLYFLSRKRLFSDLPSKCVEEILDFETIYVGVFYVGPSATLFFHTSSCFCALHVVLES